MEISTKTRNSIFYILLFNSIVASLAQTVLNTALAPIMVDMNITAGTAQWLISSFSLVMGIMVLATAFLIKKFSCRILYISSVILFCTGLLLAATAQNFTMLLIGRIFQALSTGILVSLTQVMILTVFPAEERGSKMGIFGLAASAAPVLAPTIAGIVIDNMGWRMIFWGALALSLIISSVGFFVIKNITENRKTKFDTFSFILCSLGFTCIIIGLGNWGSAYLSVINVFIPIIIGLISLFCFIYRQKKLPEPFLQLNIFKNREFKIAVIANMILFCGTIATSTLLPLYMQSMRGFSATTSGLITMPGSLLTAFISPIAGKIYDKLGIRKLYLWGASIMMIGHILFSFLSATTAIPILILIFSIRQLGIGLLLMPTITWGMSTLEKQYVSDGTAIINSLRTIAGSLGTVLFVSIMTVASRGSEPAQMIYGVNIAFIGIASLKFLLLIIAILFIGKEKPFVLSDTIINGK